MFSSFLFLVAVLLRLLSVYLTILKENYLATNKNENIPYVHKAMYSVQNRPREGELVVNGMKVT